MLALMARRLLLSIVTWVMASGIVFSITELLPGDMATAYLGREATPERLAEFRTALDLNRPVAIRFVSWGHNLLTGSFGTSFGRRRPVSELLKVRGRNTFLLASIAALFGIPLAILLGLIAGLSYEHSIDVLLSALAIGVMSVPTFVTALCLTYLFSIELRLLPAITSVAADAPIMALLSTAILPTASLSLIIVAPILGMVRTRVIDMMGSEFVQMAILRGVPFGRVVWRYVLPNAMLPTIQVLALTTSSLFAGAVIIEAVFNYPGLGTLTLSAIHDRDVPLLQGIAVLLATICVVTNLVADLLALSLNPRVRSLRTHFGEAK
jgi:peptide/nickel transport system permease protein